MSEDTTFYAIVVKNKVKYKATFKKNGEGVESIGSEELTCDTLGESCSIEMPSIKVKEGYEVVGWSTNSDATETDIKVGMKVEINSDTIYYAITKKKAITYKVTFKRNGAQTLDGLAEDTVEKTCTIPEAWNDEKQGTQCEITTPTVVSGHGSTSGETNFISRDKLYLLSPKEVWNSGYGYDSAESETRQLDYYKNAQESLKFADGTCKMYSGTSCDRWWLRSASETNVTHYFIVNASGSYNGSHANIVRGVSPAFRIA